jgi:hypothetical protein
MSEKSMSKGPILRALGGGEVRVLTTRKDCETRTITMGEQSAPALADSLIAFRADSYREFEPGSDLWDFVVVENGEKLHVYLAGDDIFMLYAPSAVL